jgi:4-hydroxy-2-oxoheptanedioate aldolase
METNQRARCLWQGGLNRRLRNGEVLFGVIVEIPDPAIVEILGLAGFDFALIDCEHGAIDLQTVASLVRACHSTPIAPLVRTAGSSPAETLRVLDGGVAGIHVPHVKTRHQAEELVQSARYHPQGNRGLNPFVRAAGFSAQPVQDYMQTANEETLVTISVEGQEGVANIDEILSVQGVDVVFVGPYDLSESLGLPGQVSHPSVTDLIIKLLERIRASGKAPGIFCNSVTAAKTWVGRGVQYVVFSVDAKIYLDACTEANRALRSGLPDETTGIS